MGRLLHEHVNFPCHSGFLKEICVILIDKVSKNSTRLIKNPSYHTPLITFI